MIVEPTNDGSWIASGKGPLRKIVAEGNSRREAMYNWAAQHAAQHQQLQEDMRALGILRGIE